MERLHTIPENLSNGDLIPDQLRVWDSNRRQFSKARACIAVQDRDQGGDTDRLIDIPKDISKDI